jgi:hypothetical protein
MISGTISLPLQGDFSTFIHITCALSVTSEYLALAHGRAEFPQGFPCPVVLGDQIQFRYLYFIYEAITLYGLPFQEIQL